LNQDCPDCNTAYEFFDHRGRGFCCGILKHKCGKCPEHDVIAFCFIKPNPLRKRHKYVMKAMEALSVATLLTGAFQAWAKNNGVELK
jgi:hypothetical protein